MTIRMEITYRKHPKITGQFFLAMSTHYLAYIGPYSFESNEMIDKEIVKTEMRMIEDSTLDVFLLEDGLCPGPVCEMVYASTLHKQMIIVYIRDDRETESSLKCPCWYPIIHCLQINESNIRIITAKDFDHAQRQILETLLEMDV